ncbi:MAG: hypothetical protein HGA54_02460 [Actinobacteria bacterium]|nr:hypothetical protein [Actinomycetota bacterium]
MTLATIRIRLRSLRAALDKRRTDTFTVPDLSPRPTLGVSDTEHFIVPGMAPEHMTYVAEELRAFGYHIDLLPQTDASCADTGLRFSDNDLCYSTVSLVGNVIRHLGGIVEANGARILVPQPCTECRGVENEIVLRDGLDKTKLAKLSIVGFPGIYRQLHVSADERRAIERALARADDDLRTRVDGRAAELGATTDVAVIGNFNLLFTPELNNHVFDLLLEEGVRPLFPSSSEVLAMNAPLLELAGGFYGRGVRDIIFLQTFGCLTSNVYGRGVGKLLKKKYPDLNITYIDYDSGVSETNQINRIKLALSIAKERVGTRPPR